MLSVNPHDFDKTVAENHVNGGLTFVQSGVYEVNLDKLEKTFLFFVGLCAKVYTFPNFIELVKLLTKFVLTCSLDTDSDD